MKTLIIYYDNKNSASDMYLKYLIKDCETRGQIYYIANDFENLKTYVENISISKIAILPMMPIKDTRVLETLKWMPSCDIDNVAGKGNYTDATAQGIYDYITKNYPDRSVTIAVIGRGKVGKTLLNLLIDYGYTVFEFNSKSDREMMEPILPYANVIVGLSSDEKPVLSECECKILNAVCFTRELIDASNTFDTKEKTRCGNWTRKVILNRLN